ncbi:MAG: hypothetical protein ACRD4S_16860 [Candidatus Acidiferrales bacterium]
MKVTKLFCSRKFGENAHAMHESEVPGESAKGKSGMICMATIMKDSPRYRQWADVLGTDTVPIESPNAHLGVFVGIGEAQCYKVAVKQLSPEQIERIVAFVSEKFQISADEVRDGILGDHGLPILARDVLVSIDARAFL